MNDLLLAQDAYVPTVVGEVRTAPVVVCGGMGGSSFPVRIARFLGAGPYLITHQDYGLPRQVPEGAHYIAISYSGETAETLSFAREAHEKGCTLSVIASGGTLLSFAKEHGYTYVEVPRGPVPRESEVAMTKALLALIGGSSLWDPRSFNEVAAEVAGMQLAEALVDAIPVFYSSERNRVLPEFAKILLNETAKIPAFMNALPEANHNELQGYGLGDEAPPLTGSLVAVFFEDVSDDERVKRRITLTKELLSAEGVRTESVELPQGTRTDAFLHSWWLSRTAAHALARKYAVDPDSTPLIDSFKKRL